VLLFGLFGAAGCLAGWAVGEGYLAAARAAADSGAARAPSLITKPAAPSDAAPPPSNEFADRLKRENARTGDVQLSLIWYNRNDLDLHCKDPSGFVIGWRPEQRRSPTGGELDVDANGGRDAPLTSEPVENIYWPKDGAPPGRYEVFINYYNHRRESGAPNETTYKVSVLYGGKREEFTGTITNNGTTDNRRPILEFQLYPKIEVFAPAELDLPPATTLKVPVAVRRSYYQGEIKVRAENLPDGVTAELLAIPEGKTEGELTLKAGESAKEIKKGVKLVGTGGDLTGSADTQLSVPKPEVRFSAVGAILIGVWTALLAVGLCLALLAGQNHYLGRPAFAAGRVPLVLVVLGAVAAGLVSGSVGQSLYSVLLSIGAGGFGLVVGWVLLGGLLGWGVSFFVPNLDRKKAALAGLVGGLLGAVGYLVWSEAANWLGRLAGAALLGFCIGLVVAIVEAAFRRAWLEVRYGARETVTVNLGPEPVKVGGDSRACTVWARGATDVALRYFVRDGRVICEDVPARSESVVGEGDTRTAGTVTLTVHTGATPAAAPPTPPRPSAPPRPVPTGGVTPPARPATPAAPPPRAPAAKAVEPPDFGDSLPVPVSPAPPARPAVPSILEDDYLPAAKPPAPARPPVPGAAPKPPTPAVPNPSTPVAGEPKPGADPDACPTCGRKSPGRPGARYCMMCEKTY
jgi:hypothetical protein